jgi:phosphatidate cytidylyltransferase
MTLFLCTWSCDVAAFLTGKRFGANLLCESVSPKKTWEGFGGGVAGSLACSALLALLFRFPPLPMLLLGLLCGVAGQLGDLGESILKREAGVKDSGSLIPGHGGFLDRFDSILINASLAFLIFEVLAG